MKTVSGLILSMGEETTNDSIRSLESQTIKVNKIFVISKVKPYARAFNTGIANIRTDFFIDCNADMLLYPNCVKRLLSFMDDDVGLVTAMLHDPLYGTVQSIKLYRTESIKSLKADRKSAIPDTDLIKNIERLGWKRAHANKHAAPNAAESEILGLHLPEYTDIYTYKKFKMLGIRITKRGTLKSFGLHWDPLIKNKHPMAKMAVIDLSIGLFCDYEKNMLDFYDVAEEFKDVKVFTDGLALKNNYCGQELINILRQDQNSPKQLFINLFTIGKRLKDQHAPEKFAAFLSAVLNLDNRIHPSHPAMAGLCYGFFYPRGRYGLPKPEEEWPKISHIN